MDYRAIRTYYHSTDQNNWELLLIEEEEDTNQNVAKHELRARLSKARIIFLIRYHLYTRLCNILFDETVGAIRWRTWTFSTREA